MEFWKEKHTLYFVSVYPTLPGTLSEEHKKDMIERMVAQGQGPITGVSSKWDFEKNQWK